MGKIIGGIVLLSLVLGVLLFYSGLLPCKSCLSAIIKPTLVVDEQTQTVKVSLNDDLIYKNGYIKVNAVYCGFGKNNKYAIVQTDTVSNPQKINVGSTVKISGETFKLKETNCGSSVRYLVLEKQ